MGTIARAGSSGTFSKPAPAGNHLAICVGVIDLGTQVQKGYQGQADAWVYQIMLQWELCDELMEDGRPYLISRKMRLSLHEMSSLRKLLEAWRGVAFTETEAQGFDIRAVLGKPCMLNVTHKPNNSGGVFANVTSASPLPKRVDAPEPVNPLHYYAIEDGEPEKAGLPKWLCDLIRKSKEFGGVGPQPGPSGNGGGATTDDKFPWEEDGAAASSTPAPFDETASPRQAERPRPAF
jgi:hypothetical protein